NQRDLPRDIPLDSVVVLRYEKRSKSENKGKVPTEMELVLEQTQQGTSYEVSVSAEGVKELKRKVKINGEKKEALLTLRQKPGQYVCCQESQRSGNPVKEFLLKLNLPDHRILKEGGEGTNEELQCCKKDGSGVDRSAFVDPFLAVMNKEYNGHRRIFGKGVTNKLIKKVNGSETSYMVLGELMESMRTDIYAELNRLVEMQKQIEDDHERKNLEIAEEYKRN
nr:hypothetical protein [Tanacetum cinerariifolium]